MRPYRGWDDLRLMQGLVQRLWPVHLHVGDLAWARSQHLGREPEWPTALWEKDGRVVAWGWTYLPGHLEFLVDPSHPDTADEVLSWFAATATADRLTTTASDAVPHQTDALRRHGFTPAEDAAPHLLRRPLADLPPVPDLPPGYAVRTSGDLSLRTEIHRVVWAPSRVTEESYAQVTTTWPYTSDLDWVATAPDGSYAASCLIWPDPVTAIGELEPVGVAPGHRERGLGRAVCLAALHALRATGATHALVSPFSSPPGHPGALKLYRSLGFTPYAGAEIYARAV